MLNALVDSRVAHIEALRQVAGVSTLVQAYLFSVQAFELLIARFLHHLSPGPKTFELFQASELRSVNSNHEF